MNFKLLALLTDIQSNMSLDEHSEVIQAAIEMIKAGEYSMEDILKLGFKIGWTVQLMESLMEEK